jgi:hypothetical protein
MLSSFARRSGEPTAWRTRYRVVSSKLWKAENGGTSTVYHRSGRDALFSCDRGCIWSLSLRSVLTFHGLVTIFGQPPGPQDAARPRLDKSRAVNQFGANYNPLRPFGRSLALPNKTRSSRRIGQMEKRQENLSLEGRRPIEMAWNRIVERWRADLVNKLQDRYGLPEPEACKKADDWLRWLKKQPDLRPPTSAAADVRDGPSPSGKHSRMRPRPSSV